ncbi:MAG: ABC transporter permease, partial [Aestuariivirga sp.]
MSDIAHSAPSSLSGKLIGHWIVAGAIVATAILLLVPETLSPLAKYPDSLVIPFKDWVGASMAWLKTNFTWLTR